MGKRRNKKKAKRRATNKYEHMKPGDGVKEQRKAQAAGGSEPGNKGSDSSSASSKRRKNAAPSSASNAPTASTPTSKETVQSPPAAHTPRPSGTASVFAAENLGSLW